MKECFDSRSPLWSNDINYNIMYVKMAENYLNERLLSRGFVTVFDIYNHLGLPIDLDELQSEVLLKGVDKIILYDITKNNCVIDFRMQPNESDGTILLDFNVD